MKYMGSKARFAKDIAAILSAERGRRPYVEPFVGGANMISSLEGTRCGYDINEPLIQMWNSLLDGSLVPRKVTRDEYEKAKYSDDLAWRGWVGFNCSYSGKYFGGYAGETKTKSGTLRDYQAEAIRNIKKQLPFLKGVKFGVSSFDKIDFFDKSVIYCDPPYKGTTEYKDKFDHSSFWDWCRGKVSDGHLVYVSEYSAPQDWECIWSVEATSSLSANGKIGGSKKSVERLFRSAA